MPEKKLPAKISGSFEYSPVNSPITKVKISAWEYPYDLFHDFKAYSSYIFATHHAINNTPESNERLLLEYSLFKRKLIGDAAFSENAFTPFSFALLMLCELINEDRYSPENALCIMKKLMGKANTFGFSPSERSMLFGYISDFCLINRLEIPFPELCGCKLIREMLMHRFYCEYSKNKQTAKNIVPELVHCICGYDYKTSVAYEANPEVYEKALCDCFVAYIDNIRNDCAKELFPDCISLTYPAYGGLAICREKAARITLTLRNYSKANHISSVAPELIKYIDNTLRRGFDIKCKISGIHLAPELRSMVQRIIYASNPELFSQKKRGRKPKERSNVDKRRNNLPQNGGFDRPNKIPTSVTPVKFEVDLEKAKLLEKQSWDIAKLVGVEYNGNSLQDDFIIVDGDGTYSSSDETPENATEKHPDDVFVDEWQEFYNLLDAKCLAFLKLALQGADAPALQSFALSVGGLADAFAAEINEISTGITGDILIENSALIEDYAEDVKRMFEQYGKEN